MVTSVMISHFTRGGQGGLREQSLQALAEVGIHPTVFESTVTNGSDVEVKRIAWHAIASGQGGDVMFFEDDILIDKNLMKAALTADKSQYDVVTFCLLKERLLPRKYKDGLVPIEAAAWAKVFHGSMGLWIAKELVDKLVEKKHEFMKEDGSHIDKPYTPSELALGKPCGFDFWLRDYTRAPAAFMPNPVKHRRDQTTTISERR